MKLLNIAAVALLSASSAASDLESRDEGGPTPICLYMTNDYNWKGEGINFCQVGGQCGSGLGMGLVQNVSSAGPPKGQTCFLYDGINCTGTGSPPIVYPGYMNLSDPVISFDNRAVSWRCWKHCGYMSSISPAPITTSSGGDPKMGTATLSSSSSTTMPVVISSTVTTVFSHTNAGHDVTVITQTFVPSARRAAD